MAGTAALVAALTIGATLIVPVMAPSFAPSFAPSLAPAFAPAWAAADNVPVPAAAPKKPGGQAAPPSLVQPPRTLLPPAAVPNLTTPTGPVTFDDNQRALVDKVSAYLSSVQTLVGDFVQVGPDGRRAEGQFFIQKPGKVRFEYNPPSPVDVVADGQSVVVRDRKLDTQQLWPLSQTPLRFLLSDHIDLMKDTNLVSVSADDMFVTVVIEETHKLVGTSRLMLMVGAKDFQLRQWTVTDPQGFDTTVAVYNLDTSKKPDPGLFKITYPDRPDPR
jgi:outer membrane lipoprotein-sorting protein